MERSDAREADWAEESSQTIALPQASRKATWRDVPDILKDIVVYAAASVVCTTLLQALIRLQMYWGMFAKIWTNEEQRLRIYLISLFTTPQEEVYKRFLDKAGLTLFWAPVCETFIFVLLWKLSRKLRVGENAFVVVAAVVFGSLHAVDRIAGNKTFFDLAFLFTCAGGAFIAGIYVKEWMRFGPNIAYVACASMHALHNFLIGVLIFAGVKLSP